MKPAAGPTQDWRQLVALAVLGWERAGGRLPAISGAPGALLAASASGPEALLRAAAVLSVYERAGRRVVDSPPAGPPMAETDTMPQCSFAAGQHLARILYGEFGFLLEEWCRLAAARGVRAPDELLAALLDRAATDAGLADELRPVLGRRGEWLADQNPVWRAIVGRGMDDSAAVWRTGDKAQRVALLARLRAADPRAARELLSQTWEQESAENRCEFLAVLETGLSLEDEPLLEAVLDDGRKTVRQAAAGLLARLPQSGFCRRMRARAAGLVSIGMQKRMLRGKRLRIEVSLPDEPDEALLRDGVENRKSGPLGARAFVLYQIIAAAPLDTWEASGASPDELIAAACETEWQAVLVRGWAAAAGRQRSAAWAGPLLKHLFRAAEEPDRDEVRRLVWALDPAERERIVAALLREPEFRSSQAVRLLEACPHAWSESFSRAALTALKGYFGTLESYGEHALRTAVSQRLARCFSPAVAEEVESDWNRSDAAWHKGDEEMVSALAATLAFRRDMQEELSR